MTTTGLPDQMLTGSNNHPNPMFDFLTGFVPRKLKDLFRWTEYLFYNSPHIFIALTKLSDYIITEVTFDTSVPSLRKNYEELFTETLRIKPVLKACARDRHIYGNAFISLYLPFKRLLPCKSCKTQWDIRHLDEYKYDWKKLTFDFDCPHCSAVSKVHLDDVKDYKVNYAKRINVIRWDPKLIDLDYNPITGETVYYYNIPATITEKIKANDPTAISSMPKEFLECLDDDSIFEFDPSKIYHMKVDAPAGVDGAWGFPPLTSTLKQFYYTQVLRKANEAIALDHLVPFRVLHPAQTGTNNDPVTTLAMGQWVAETKKNIKQHRRDPLHIMFAPVALGVTQMGGQGRTLLTLGEVKDAEDNIIASLGVPREFLFGGLSFTGSTVTLRMLENQLVSHAADIKALLQWIADSVGDFMGWQHIKTDISNFRFVDDVQQKSMLMQVNQTYDILSKRSIAEIFEIKYDSEKQKKADEVMEDVKAQTELERKIEAYQTSLAEQAMEESGAGQGLNYDQQAVIGEADMMVEQLLQMDEGMRRSQLDALQSEDYVMYSVVIQRLENAHLQQRNEAMAQME